MSTAVATVQPAEQSAPPSYWEKLLNGDLNPLTPEERTAYYLERCNRLGLDPMSQPFLFLQTKARDNEPSKTILYATRSATDQIAKRDSLSGSIVSTTFTGGVAIATVRISDGKRSIENVGAASYKYDYQAGDALKRAVTQGYRRGIIQFSGLGMVSEEDIADIPGAVDLQMHDVQITAAPAPAGQARQEPEAPIGHLAPAQPHRASQVPASDRAQGDHATPAQMSRIHKLYEALGRGQVVADMTSEAAGKLIAELVTEFNARSRSAREQQAPTAIFDPLPEAPTEPPTQRQLDGIAQILTLLRAFHGKDQSEGAIHSKLHAKQRLDVLMQLLRAPVPEPGLPASDEARELVLNAAADLLHAGGSAESVPAELTRSAAWVMYQRLREDLKTLTGELK